MTILEEDLDKKRRMSKALHYIESHCNKCGNALSPFDYRLGIIYENDKPLEVKLCNKC